MLIFLPSVSRRSALLTLFSTLCLGVVSCASPTLPLPPPEQPDSVQPSQTDPETWLVHGSCQPGALVTVFDERTGRGVVVEDSERTGRYSVELEAKKCDLGWVSQVVGEDASTRTMFVVQGRTNGTVDDQSACK